MKIFSVLFRPFLLASALAAEPRSQKDAPATLPATGAIQAALANNRSIREARARWESIGTFLELVSSQRRLREVESIDRQRLADDQTALAELEAQVGADLHYFPRKPEIPGRETT